MPNTNDIFHASTEPLGRLFSPDFAYSLPEYQRNYRWSEETVDGVLESLMRGVERLVDPEVPVDDALTFLGAMVTLEGTVEAGLAPAGARQVIDGQQRLTTLMLLLVAGHTLLSEFGDPVAEIASDVQLDDEDLQEAARILTIEVNQLKRRIIDQIVFEAFDEEDVRPRPRIIREKVDYWSRDLNQLRYVSPVSSFVWAYYASLDNPGGKFEPPVSLEIPAPHGDPAPLGCDDADYRHLLDRFKQVETALSCAAKREPTVITEHWANLNTDYLISMFSSDQAFLELFGDHLELAQRDLIVASCDQSEEIAQVCRLLALMVFVRRFIALTVIHVRVIDYAFDLFDSLNSGGEPLSALETFRPRVVKGREEIVDGGDPERRGAWDRAMKNLNEVQELVRQDQGTLSTSRTKTFLSAFALSETGYKLGNSISSQRRWLNREFSGLGEDGQPGMIRSMKDCADSYFRLFHHVEREQLQPEIVLDPESEFLLSVMKDLKHELIVPPISRYLAAALVQDEGGEACNELNGAIKTLGAFSLVWRAIGGGAAGIDSHYRGLMNGRPPRRANQPPSATAGLSRLNGSQGEIRELLSIADLRTWCRQELMLKWGGEVIDREWWVSMVRYRPVGLQQKVSRALLFLAHSGAVPDPDNVGTLVDAWGQGELGLSAQMWSDDEAYETVEHIAPRTPTGNQMPEGDCFDARFYGEANDAIQSLGNLILLPQAINSSLNNRSWPEKRAIYRAVSAESETQVTNALDEVPDITDKTRETILESRQRLAFVRAIAATQGSWTVEWTQTRTENLLGRAWDSSLGRWLSEGQDEAQ